MAPDQTRAEQHVAPGRSGQKVTVADVGARAGTTRSRIQEHRGATAIHSRRAASISAARWRRRFTRQSIVTIIPYGSVGVGGHRVDRGSHTEVPRGAGSCSAITSGFRALRFVDRRAAWWVRFPSPPSSSIGCPTGLAAISRPYSRVSLREGQWYRDVVLVVVVHAVGVMQVTGQRHVQVEDRIPRGVDFGDRRYLVYWCRPVACRPPRDQPVIVSSTVTPPCAYEKPCPSGRRYSRVNEA